MAFLYLDRSPTIGPLPTHACPIAEPNPEIYAGDKILTVLRLCNPSELPPHGRRKKMLPGPLFDLVALQELLRQGTLDLSDDRHFYLATDDCWRDMKALKWTANGKLRDALLLLKPGARGKLQGDYINSQWAKDSDSNWHHCDAYSICIDERNGFSRARNAPETYIKFSIDEDGSICLVMISCHPSS